MKCAFSYFPFLECFPCGVSPDLGLKTQIKKRDSYDKELFYLMFHVSLNKLDL